LRLKSIQVFVIDEDRWGSEPHPYVTVPREVFKIEFKNVHRFLNGAQCLVESPSQDWTVRAALKV
jgi:hypothetical protein